MRTPLRGRSPFGYAAGFASRRDVHRDHIERTQIVVEPRDGVPRDDGPAAGAAPRTPAGSTPPTEKIPSVGAEHLSECRVDGVEIKVIDSIAAPAFPRRDNRSMLQEPQAPSLERTAPDGHHVR